MIGQIVERMAQITTQLKVFARKPKGGIGPVAIGRSLDHALGRRSRGRAQRIEVRRPPEDAEALADGTASSRCSSTCSATRRMPSAAATAARSRSASRQPRTGHDRGPRQRARHPDGGPAPSVRAVLHHQGPGRRLGLSLTIYEGIVRDLGTLRATAGGGWRRVHRRAAGPAAVGGDPRADQPGSCSSRTTPPVRFGGAGAEPRRHRRRGVRLRRGRPAAPPPVLSRRGRDRRQDARDSGLELLDHASRIDPALPVILITGHGDVAMAVQAMKAGAYDFIEKPFPSDYLIGVVQRLEKRRLTFEVRSCAASSRTPGRRTDPDRPVGADGGAAPAPSPSSATLLGPADRGRDRHRQGTRGAMPASTSGCATGVSWP